MALSYDNNRTSRELPSSLKTKLIVSDFKFWYGTLFWVVSTILIVLFSRNIDFKSLVFSPNQKAQGTIVGKEATNCSINNKPVKKYTYKFAVGARDVTGHSYANDMIDPYSPVEIEYEGSKPQNSRIVNTRLAPFPFWMVLPLLIFPAVSLSIIITHIRHVKRVIYMVSHGVLTKGKIVGKEIIKRNKKTLYVVSFEFYDKAGTLIQTTCTTPQAPDKAMDEAEEFLVYESQNPQNAVLLDTLNGSVKKFLLEQHE